MAQKKGTRNADFKRMRIRKEPKHYRSAQNSLIGVAFFFWLSAILSPISYENLPIPIYITAKPDR